MSATITETVTQVFKKEVCCNCQIPFFVTEAFMTRRRQDKDYFYCPNGHAQHYTESDADRLRKENERLKAKLENEAASAAFFKDEADRKARQLSAAKGENTKLRKRVQSGVCPCCNRSFQNLRRHMATKHGTGVEVGTDGGACAERDETSALAMGRTQLPSRRRPGGRVR